MPTRSSGAHRVIILHANDPTEATDFCRGVARFRPAGGPWRLQSIPFPRSTARFPSRLVRGPHCDGIIMMPGRKAPLMALHRAGVCVVDVDDTLDGAPDLPFPQVRLDHRHLGRLAAEHLMERGFRRLLYVGDDLAWSRARADGFAQTAKRARINCQRVIAPDYPTLKRERWLRARLKDVDQPFGVFACNDDVGARIIDIAETEGWTVPTRLAVVGVDDRITDCLRVRPPLSSISIERFQAGYEAAKLLDGLFTNAQARPPIHWLRPARVTERESTSAYLYDDADVVTSLAFIRRAGLGTITVDDVLRRVNLSRSTLTRRFVRLVGRPPGDEIRRVRLEAVVRLLEQTQKPLAAIAEETGFASISSLSHCFHTAKGVSPNAYRRSLRDGPHPDRF